MQIYMAPLEGITGYIYRNEQEKLFGGIDKYYAPFIDAAVKRSMKSKELRDILPENNEHVHLVPQIMTNDGEAFRKTLEEMRDFGYDEVNLNLGCPSGTVVAKGRGAGFLADTEKLEYFFDQVFQMAKIKISIKTRIGINHPREMQKLLQVYNRFPFSEIIIHPRVQKDFYKNKPNLKVFAEVLEKSCHPVCYNGDLFSVEDYENFVEQFPSVERVMLGRGLLQNPAMARQILGGKPLEQAELQSLHDGVCLAYQEYMSGEMPVLHKMKELWVYWIANFAHGEKSIKKIRKAKHLSEYTIAVHELFGGSI